MGCIVALLLGLLAAVPAAATGADGVFAAVPEAATGADGVLAAVPAAATGADGLLVAVAPAIAVPVAATGADGLLVAVAPAIAAPVAASGADDAQLSWARLRARGAASVTASPSASQRSVNDPCAASVTASPSASQCSVNDPFPTSRQLNVLPYCNISMFADEIIDRCPYDHPTASCCEPVLAAFSAGRNASCVCLMMLGDQMQSSLITAEDVFRVYHLCGGEPSIDSDVCKSFDPSTAFTSSPPQPTLVLGSQPVPSPADLPSQQPTVEAPASTALVTGDSHSGAKGNDTLWLVLQVIPMCCLMVACICWLRRKPNSRRSRHQSPEVSLFAPPPAPAMLSAAHPVPPPAPGMLPAVHPRHALTSPALPAPPRSSPPTSLQPSLPQLELTLVSNDGPDEEAAEGALQQHEDEEAALQVRRRGTRTRRPVIRLNL